MVNNQNWQQWFFGKKNVVRHFGYSMEKIWNRNSSSTTLVKYLIAKEKIVIRLIRVIKVCVYIRMLYFDCNWIQFSLHQSRILMMLMIFVIHSMWSWDERTIFSLCLWKTARNATKNRFTRFRHSFYSDASFA